MVEYTEGVMADGAAILKDGQPMTISEILAALNGYADVEDNLRNALVAIAALEEMRPHWAKGYTSDSIAAQAAFVALNQIWELLGVDNQTAAMSILRKSGQNQRAA